MISAVVHTYNEEKNIDHSLSSLSPWVDEIIVVDMNSTDKTVEKAKSYKAKIYSFQYTGFVEPARNFGIEKAKGDWILILDADEEVSLSLSRKLIQITKDNHIDFCRIPRKNIIWSKWIRHAGWWPDFQTRFFKKGHVKWSDKIHGVPLTKGNGLDLPAEEDLSIIHYNYNSLEQFISRLNRYTSISAKELYIQNKSFDKKLVVSSYTGEFIKRFFVEEGYKDGLHGLVLAIMQGFSEAVVYFKLWELNSFKEEKVSLREMENYINYENKQKKYWLYNELLKRPNNIFDDIICRIKRKLVNYG